MWYPLLLLLKFCCVLAYAGGAAATLTAESDALRKWAAHRLASWALLGVWVVGYLLTQQIGVSLTELWIVGGFFFSFLAQGAIEFVAARGKRGLGPVALVSAPLLAALVMMVYRPTWSVFG